MFDFFKKADKFIIIAYVFLVFIGLYFVMNISSYGQMAKFIKQIVWVLISFGAVLISFEMDLEKIKKLIPYMLFFVSCLLILVLFFGVEIRGAKRLFHFGFISFQPSLLARLVLILYFAYILDKKKNCNVSGIKDFFANYKQIILVSIVIFSLILAGRHLSILIILGLSLLMMLIAAGISKRVVIILISVLAVLLVVVISFGASFRLQRIGVYQKYNLLMSEDTSFVLREGADYSTKQSLMALASGGFFGGDGRAKDSNLPEADTDYIFSVIAEEFGFFGAFIIIIGFAIIYFRALKLLSDETNLYKKLMGVGLVHNIFYNAIVHIGVTISMLPPTGVTLPFISYGGTSMLVNSLSIGIILNLTKKEI